MNADWVKVLTDSYKEGFSDVEVCRELRITMKQFTSMYDKNDKFAELVDFGRMLSHAWWMEKARKNLNMRDFNTSLYVMVMKNRYGWAEKLEASQVDSSDLQSVRELRARLEKELPKLVKSLTPSLTDASLLDKTQDILHATS
jgi:hypothetical protein